MAGYGSIRRKAAEKWTQRFSLLEISIRYTWRLCPFFGHLRSVVSIFWIPAIIYEDIYTKFHVKFEASVQRLSYSRHKFLQRDGTEQSTHC